MNIAITLESLENAIASLPEQPDDYVIRCSTRSLQLLRAKLNARESTATNPIVAFTGIPIQTSYRLPWWAVTMINLSVLDRAAVSGTEEPGWMQVFDLRSA